MVWTIYSHKIQNPVQSIDLVKLQHNWWALELVETCLVHSNYQVSKFCHPKLFADCLYSSLLFDYCRGTLDSLSPSNTSSKLSFLKFSCEITLMNMPVLFQVTLVILSLHGYHLCYLWLNYYMFIICTLINQYCYTF